MMKLFSQLNSFYKALVLWSQRTFDQTYRTIIGVPTLKFSQISPQLYLGGQYSRRGYTILKKRGITAIVSMRTYIRKDLPDLGAIRFLNLPTPDQAAPSLVDLKKGVTFMTEELQRGGKIYVHCYYGEGRGPSMMAAYLISTGLTMEHALDQIRAIRGFIGLSPAQLERLKEFETSIKKKKTPDVRK